MKNSILKKRIYWITLFFITLSGFAQMPIFKRYYIADIPGLGWLADFYVTHIIHYTSAIILMVMVFYLAVLFLLQGYRLSNITGAALLKVGLLAGLIITGGLLAYKNMSGVYLDHVLISILDLAHLGFCMLLLFAGLYSIIKKSAWLRS